MNQYTVATLLEETKFQEVHIKGWVRTFRANRFIALNDGSTINNIQCVVDFENFDESCQLKYAQHLIDNDQVQYWCYWQ